FLGGAAAVFTYVRGRAASPLGHNPLGGWSVAAMLAVLTLQITLGLFAVDEDGLDPSPLSKFVDFDTGRLIAKLHHELFYVLLTLIALHLAAITSYAVRGRNLLGPMITGRLSMDRATQTPRFASVWLPIPLAAF